MTPPPPRSTLFPYTTLFRSLVERGGVTKFVSVTDPPGRMLKHFVRLMGEPKGVLLPIHNGMTDRKSTRLNSSHVEISYAVFCLKKKTTTQERLTRPQRARRC